MLEKTKVKPKTIKVKPVYQEIPEDFQLNYPYKTGYKKRQFKTDNPEIEQTEKIPDYNTKKLKKEL